MDVRRVVDVSPRLNRHQPGDISQEEVELSYPAGGKPCIANGEVADNVQPTSPS